MSDPHASSSTAIVAAPLDVVVGGAGDRLFGCARAYARNWADRHPERQVVYLAQGRRRTLLRLVSGRPGLNLIGHSWGAADVDWALRRSAKASPGLIVGVDPVGKPGPMRRCDVLDCAGVLTLWGRGSEGRIADGNLAARLGRFIGHDRPALFASVGAVVVEAPFAHYDIGRMMSHAGPDGLSAEDRLLLS